ncbi:MAG: ribosome biogenesis GTP-binding protein YihA/YsxC [bacterium]
MKILSAEFVLSAVHEKDYPAEILPEVAFVGRSNVGKSSLINALLNRKKLVKVSSTPGRTQMINFFLINQALYFVDLPGYGFAKVPKDVRERFGPMVEQYLEKNQSLCCVVHILDARHKPTQGDRLMREYLLYHGIRVLTAVTKSDKVPMGQRRTQVRQIREFMGLAEEDLLILFSAVTSEGRNEIWKALSPLI